MEREAVGDQALPVGAFQDVGGEFRLAAELARQRPFGAGAVAMDAADHAAAGRGARDLVDLGLAVDREQRDAEPEGGGDLALFLDRCCRRRCGPAWQPVASTASVSRTEATSKEEPSRLSRTQDFRMRIGLDRVVDLGVGQRLGEGTVVVAHDVEVEHQAGPFLFAVLEELADAICHLD